MKKSFWLFFLLASVCLSAQSPQYFYIQKLAVAQCKPSGKHWDAWGGAPDIKITVSLLRGHMPWQQAFVSPIIKNTHHIRRSIPTRLDISGYTAIKITIEDHDLARSDLIGTQIIAIKDIIAGREQEISFGSVKSLVYLVTSYKTLAVSAAQERIFSDASRSIDSAKSYLRSSYSVASAKPYLKKAHQQLELLRSQLPGHPRLEGLTAKLATLEQQLADREVETLVKKIKNAASWYETALQRRESNARMQKHLENVQSLLSQLDKYKDLSAGKSAYERWSRWVAKQEEVAIQIQGARQVENARKRLRSILSWTGPYKKPAYLHKLIKYANDAKPYVEILSRQAGRHRDLLDQYQQLLATIKQLQTPVPDPTPAKPQPKMPVAEPTPAKPQPKMPVAEPTPAKPQPKAEDSSEVKNAKMRLRSILSWTRPYNKPAYLHKLIKYSNNAKPYVEILSRQADRHRDLLDQYQQLLATIKQLQTPVADPTPAKPQPKTPVVDPTPAKPQPKMPVADPTPAKPQPKTPVVDPTPAKPQPKTEDSSEVKNAKMRLRSILSWTRPYNKPAYLHKLIKYANDAKPYVEILQRQPDRHRDMLDQYQQLIGRIDVLKKGKADDLATPSKIKKPRPNSKKPADPAFAANPVVRSKLIAAYRRLYSLLSYADNYRNNCLKSIQTAEKNGKGNELSFAWQALGHVDKYLRDGKGKAELLTANPLTEQEIAVENLKPKELLTRYQALSEFSASQHAKLKILSAKSWDQFLLTSFSRLNQSFAKFDQLVTACPERIEQSSSPEEESGYVLRDLKYAIADIQGALQDLRKQADNDKASGWNLSPEVELKGSAHPALIEAGDKMIATQNSMKELEAKISGLGFVTKGKQLLKDAQFFFERGVKNKDESDIKGGLLRYEETIAYLQKHKDQTGVAVLLAQVIQEKESPQVTEHIKSQARQKEREQQAAVIEKNFNDKKNLLENLYAKEMPAEQILELFAEVEKELAAYEKYKDLRSVQHSYSSAQGWVKYFRDRMDRLRAKIKAEKALAKITIKTTGVLQTGDKVRARYSHGQEPFISEVIDFYGRLIHLRSLKPDYHRDYWATSDLISGDCRHEAKPLDANDGKLLLRKKPGEYCEIVHPNGASYLGKVEDNYGKMALVRAGDKNWTPVWTPPEKICMSWLPDKAVVFCHGQLNKDLAFITSKGVVKTQWGQTLAYFKKDKRQLVDSYGKVLCTIAEDGTGRNSYGHVLYRLAPDAGGARIEDVYGKNLGVVNTYKHEILDVWGQRQVTLRAYQRGSIRVIAAVYMHILKPLVKK